MSIAGMLNSLVYVNSTVSEADKQKLQAGYWTSLSKRDRDNCQVVHSTISSDMIIGTATGAFLGLCFLWRSRRLGIRMLNPRGLVHVEYTHGKEG